MIDHSAPDQSNPILWVAGSLKALKRPINNVSASSLAPPRKDNNTGKDVRDQNKGNILPLRGPAGMCDMFSSRNSHNQLCWDASSGEVGPESWILALKALSSNAIDTSIYPDYSKNVPFSTYITRKYNICRILQHRYSRIFKVNWLVAMVNSIISINPDILLVLSDRTGQMVGFLHRDAIKAYRNYITSDCTLLLSNVFVYVPIGDNPYIIITKKSINQIFHNSTDNTN